MAKTVSTFRDQSRRQLQVGDKTYDFFSIAALAEQFPGVKTFRFQSRCFWKICFAMKMGIA